MKTSLMRFFTKDGLRLDGLLFEPVRKTNKTIVHVHGTSSNFYRSNFIDTFASQFTKAGFALLTFNNRGTGLRYEFVKKNGRATIGSENEIFEDCELDIQAAIDFAKSKSQSEIILSGHSYGCNKVVWYATQKNFEGKIILLAPVDIRRPKDTMQQKARDCTNIDMFRYRDGQIVPVLAKMKNDILIQMGAQDKSVAQENKQDCIDYLKTAFVNARVCAHLLKDADHGFTNREGEVAKNIVEWLKTPPPEGWHHL